MTEIYKSGLEALKTKVEEGNRLITLAPSRTICATGPNRPRDHALATPLSLISRVPHDRRSRCDNAPSSPLIGGKPAGVAVMRLSKANNSEGHSLAKLAHGWARRNSLRCFWGVFSSPRARVRRSPQNFRRPISMTATCSVSSSRKWRSKSFSVSEWLTIKANNLSTTHAPTMSVVLIGPDVENAPKGLRRFGPLASDLPTHQL